MDFYLFLHLLLQNRSKASTCRATSETACSKLLNQCCLKLYHYTSRLRLQLGRGSGFYMRAEADDRTRHPRKRRRVQCVENSDHCALASACVTFVQDGHDLFCQYHISRYQIGGAHLVSPYSN